MLETASAFRRELEQNGLMTRGEIDAFIEQMPVPPKSGEEFAKLLVNAGHLTKYQARVVHQGHAGELVFDQYVLLKKIGAGGMGQVYLARHSRMKRQVAVKVLPPDAMDDEKSIQRFQREVEAAAQLAHPNIVTSFDAGEANGKHYFVMEYVPGVDLETLVKQNGPLSPGRAVECLRQAAEGLKYAHGRGVVHRDIKPANLLLAEDGTVKILDMGLARFDEPGNIGEQAGLTNTGAIMGTVDYMSPEQALDTRSADARSDIYSLGCTLHFLLTGKPVYGGDTLMKRLLAHREADSPALTVDFTGESSETGWDKDLDTLFQTMIAKSIASRFQSMEEVLAAIDELQLPADESATGPISIVSVAGERHTERLGGTSRESKFGSVATQQTADVQLADFHLNETIQTDYLNETVTLGARTAKPTRRTRGRHNGIIAGAIAVGLLLIAGLFLWSPWSTTPADDGTTDTSNPDETKAFPPLEGPAGLAQTFRFPEFGITCCRVIGDGKTLMAGCNDGMIRIIDLSTGRVTQTIKDAHKHQVRDLDISHDGKRVLSASADQTIKLWELKSGKLIRQFYGHTNKVTSARFFPGDDRFVSTSFDGSVRFWKVGESAPAVTRMYERSKLPGKPRTTDDLRKLKAHLSWVRTAAVSSDGKFVITGGNDSFLMKWNTRTASLVGVFAGHNFVVANAVISPDDKHVLSAGFDNKIVLWNAQKGNPIREFRGHVATVFEVTFSRNGRRALSASDDGTVRLWDVSTGKAIRVFEGHKGRVRRVNFCANDRFAVSTGEDNTVCLWRLPQAGKR